MNHDLLELKKIPLKVFFSLLQDCEKINFFTNKVILKKKDSNIFLMSNTLFIINLHKIILNFSGK